MRTTILSVALAMAGATTAFGQTTVITPPSGGVAIVDGGHYVAGTIFANGMAYPAGTVVQANATVSPGVQYVTPAGATFAFGPSGNYYRPAYSGTYYSNYGTRYGYPYSNYYSPVTAWGNNAWTGNTYWQSGFTNTAFGRGYGAYRGGFGRWR